ncbi:MAG: hypothetical protein AAFU03_18510, partial [Bacteroidota bacterium]
FTWPVSNNETYYEFHLVDSLTNEAVMLASFNGNEQPIDLSRLQMQTNATYYWEVFYINPGAGEDELGEDTGSDDKTPRLYFQLAGNEEYTIVTEVEATELYKETVGIGQRHLMKAMRLEESGFLYAAEKSLMTGLEAEPGNELIRRSYAAFLARWKGPQAAEKLLKN